MTAYIITTDGRGFVHHGRYKSEDGAIRKLLSLITECVEIRCLGAEREPREVTAEWLMANCREVVVK